MKSGIAVIGELNVDLIASGLRSEPKLGQELIAEDFKTALGSSSAIFACGAAKLGNEVTFISLVGDDDFGRFCVEKLSESNISNRFITTVPDIKTGVTLVLSTKADRALVTYPGSIAELGFDAIPLDALKGHRHLHLTSYFLQTKLRPDFVRLMIEARSCGLSVSFDPNADPSQVWGSEIYEAIESADILFLNESEAKQLTSNDDLEPAVRQLGQYCPCVVVKLGVAGAIALRAGEITRSEGFSINAVDTTGAGDSFAAGFIDAFLHEKSLSECLAAGNACGALSTRQPGGTDAQPDREELNAFLLASNASSGRAA